MHINDKRQYQQSVNNKTNTAYWNTDKGQTYEAQLS